MSSACNTAFTCFLTINALAWTKMQGQAQSLWLSGTSNAQTLWLTSTAKAQDLWSKGTQDLWLNSVEPRLQAIDAQWLALGPANQELITAITWGLFLGVSMGLLYNALQPAFVQDYTQQALLMDVPYKQTEAVKPLFPPSPALRRSTRPTVAPERFAPPTHIKAPAKRSKAKQQTKATAKPKGLTSMYLYHDIQTINGLDTRKGYYDQSSGYIQDTSTKAWTTLNAFALNHFHTLAAAGLTTRKSYKCSIGTALYALNRGHKKALSAFC